MVFSSSLDEVTSEVFSDSGGESWGSGEGAESSGSLSGADSSGSAGLDSIFNSVVVGASFFPEILK